mmetsp:Transcript_24569/g.57208  ORF Transcript_24569/g.57208 Transcript_24569/m.57208 type:complete len:204 (-) Transcript_24569:774-1385(-)
MSRRSGEASRRTRHSCAPSSTRTLGWPPRRTPGATLQRPPPPLAPCMRVRSPTGCYPARRCATGCALSWPTLARWIRWWRRSMHAASRCWAPRRRTPRSALCCDGTRGSSRCGRSCTPACARRSPLGRLSCSSLTGACGSSPSRPSWPSCSSELRQSVARPRGRTSSFASPRVEGGRPPRICSTPCFARAHTLTRRLRPLSRR